MITDKIKNILDEITIEKLLIKLGSKRISKNGREIRCTCPIHKGDNENAFVWNLDTNLWFCFTGCVAGGDIFDLIEQIFKPESFKANIIMCCDLLEISFSAEELNSVKSRDMKEQRQFVQHMIKMTRNKTNQRYDLQLLGTHRKINSYRNFDSELLTSHGVTYIEELKRVSFPIKDENGLIVGSSCRTITTELPKWKHYPQSISTGVLLWGLDTVDVNNDICFITEGISDVLNLRRLGINNSVCTFGANITQEQIKLLLSRFTNVVLMYDNDKAGENATKKFIDKYRFYFNLKVADLSSINVHDAGEIKDEESFCLIKQINWYKYLHREDEQ